MINIILFLIILSIFLYFCSPLLKNNEGLDNCDTPPIKHWRRQLFPRQYIDQEGQPLPDLPQDQTDLNPNKITRGRHYNGINLFDYPNGYSITTIKLLSEAIEMKDGSRALSCQPIWFIDKNVRENSDASNCLFFNKDSPLTRSQCSQRSALIRARPGSYNDRGPFQFQSNKGYLQSRSRLFYQVSIIYTPNIYNNTCYVSERLENIIWSKSFPPSTFSLYRNNKPLVDTYSISKMQTCYDTDISINAIAIQHKNVCVNRQ